MSDALPSYSSIRSLTSQESALMRYLLKESPALLASMDGVLVTEMADGGMGSLYFGSPGGRSMGRAVAEAKSIDVDQVPVLISVNVDQDGELFELDIWKVDYSPLQHFPDPADVQRMQ